MALTHGVRALNLIRELKPGTTVNLSYKDKLHIAINMSMTYVGLVANDYLIFKFQNANSALHDMYDLGPGVPITVRTVVTQEYLMALNFTTTSLGISKLREPMLLVQYPTNVKGQQLRTTPRIAVELMANVKFQDGKFEYLALITDFSMTGLKCEYLLNEEGNNLSVEQLKSQAVTIDFVANDDLDINFSITGEVKNIKQKEKVHLGIMFDEAALADVKAAFAILLMREYGL